MEKDVGYPMVNVQDIETGKVRTTCALIAMRLRFCGSVAISIRTGYVLCLEFPLLANQARRPTQ